MAGTGKFTIARTIAGEYFNRKYLGANSSSPMMGKISVTLESSTSLLPCS